MPVLPDVGSRMIESGVQQAALLEVLDQVLRDAILDRAGRVRHLELGEDADVRVRRHARDLDQRRVADRLEHVRVPAAVQGEALVGVEMVVRRRVQRLAPELLREGHAQPPAIAGSSRTSSDGVTGVSSPWR